MLEHFSSRGVDIAFIDVQPEAGDLGEPVLLIHGFASNHRVNWVEPGWVETLDPGRAPRRRLRQSRPRAKRKTLRARRLSRRTHDPGRGQSASAFGDRTRRRDGLFDGGADREPSRARRAEARARAYPRRDRRPADARRRVAARRSPRRSRRRRSTASPIRRSACSAPSPSGRRATSPRSPPASAARGEVSRPPKPDGSPSRRWWRWANAIRSPAIPHKLAAMLPHAEAFDIPGRDHNLAVGDKAFKARALDFLERRE